MSETGENTNLQKPGFRKTAEERIGEKPISDSASLKIEYDEPENLKKLRESIHQFHKHELSPDMMETKLEEVTQTNSKHEESIFSKIGNYWEKFKSSVNERVKDYTKPILRVFGKNAGSSVLDMWHTGIIGASEITRWSIFSSLGRKGFNYEGPPPILPEPFHYVIQHIGDLGIAWEMSFLGYYAAIVATYPLKNRIPENIREGFAIAAGLTLGIGMTLKAEVVGGIGQADWADIPAGVIGSVGFCLTHMYLKSLIQHTDKEITELESQLNK